MPYNHADKPTATEFAEVLQEESRWYTLGVFIGTPKAVLNYISMTYTNFGILRCLIEVHNSLKQRDILPNWGTITDALRKMKNYPLANTICPKPKVLSAVTVKTEVITIEDDDHVTPHRKRSSRNESEESSSKRIPSIKIEPNSVKQEKQDDYDQSDTSVHRLRSRSYSGEEPPVKRKPSSTLHDSDGQSSSQDMTNQMSKNQNDTPSSDMDTTEENHSIACPPSEGTIPGPYKGYHSASNQKYPSIDQFADALSTEPNWYSLGIFLEVPTKELKDIDRNQNCIKNYDNYMELYKYLESKAKIPSWKSVIRCLERMKKYELAQRISAHQSKSIINCSHPIAATSSNDDESQSIEVIPPEIENRFESLTNKFTALNRDVLTKANVSIIDLKQLIVKCRPNLEPSLEAEANVESVLQKLEESFSIFDYPVLKFFVQKLPSDDHELMEEITDYETDVNEFKALAKMCHLISLIKDKKLTSQHANHITLTVREFWNDMTISQFENGVNEILGTSVDMFVNNSKMNDNGCTCINFIIPNTTKIDVPAHSLQFIQLIGIISLHIGSDVIYNIEGEGCETIKAAMLQAIELKNTRAIELLLAMGCNPEVATYTGDNAVTTIVNIRESKKSSVDHVCIIGHNEHVEAIVHPTSKPTECSSCSINKTMNKQLLQEIDTLRQKQTTFHQEQTVLLEEQTDELQLTVKTKDAEIKKLTERMIVKDAENTLLQKDVELLIKEKLTIGNMFTIQRLELNNDEQTLIGISINVAGDVRVDYRQNSDCETTHTSEYEQSAQNTCTAYDHFGIFYCHEFRHETWELCLIVDSNLKDLNKHIKIMKIPFEESRFITFAFKDKSETLKLKIIDPIPIGSNIMEQEKCEISKKTIDALKSQKPEEDCEYPHKADCRITMHIKPAEKTQFLHVKIEGIISDKVDHIQPIGKNPTESQGTTTRPMPDSEQTSNSNESGTRLHRLRSRSYSGEEPPPKRKPPTAKPVGQSSSQDSTSRCKLLVSSLRHNHSDICDVLFKNSIVLSYLKTSLYSKFVIDPATKKDIGEKHDDVSRLMDLVSAYIEGGEGDNGINRCEVVMKCLNDQEALRDIVKKINEYRK